MKTLKFKTNIKCGGCVATVTPFLNATVGEGRWQVDVQNPDKILTTETDSATLADIRQAIEKAGYKAEPLS
ncbi:heavy-metal-associated domain-containing protein [Spirosoma sp. KNUC1025]|uniref:heavy-metal-associated domain-containing protein n=1 Tax=Spirosoma sp. KNUC1025 TaxID=2894082 RepID=UPI00386D0C5D|nr:heavy-metal-associated domain-containing protein [Spirosoma sp. KNUC1025]